MAWNISQHWYDALTKMETPWFLRFGQQFPGRRPIFGQLVWFRPMKPTVEKMPKFESRGQWGVFVGWDFQPGRKWDKVYMVAAMSAFKKGAPKKVRIHYISEMQMKDGPPVFPLQQEFQRELLKIDCGHKTLPDTSSDVDQVGGGIDAAVVPDHATIPTTTVTTSSAPGSSSDVAPISQPSTGPAGANADRMGAGQAGADHPKDNQQQDAMEVNKQNYEKFKEFEDIKELDNGDTIVKGNAETPALVARTMASNQTEPRRNETGTCKV